MRIILCSVVLAAVLSHPAQAQPQGQQICAPRKALVEKLKAEFNEELEAIGVANSGGLFEILTSDEGTWTVLATGTSGISCLVLSGDGWMRNNKLANRPSY